MAISKTQSVGRLIITVPVIFAGLWALKAGVPFSSVSTEQQWWIGVFRAVYGGLATFRIIRTLPGAAILQGWQNVASTRRVYLSWLLVTACIGAGFLTPLALFAHWLFGVLLQRTNRVYSIEDVLFRCTGFCLLFLQSHLAFSVDAALGWNFGLGSPFVLGVNFFAWTVGLLMWSAGLEKMFSPLWHKGLGFYYFMSLPHLVRPCFANLNRSRALSVVLSWITVLAELLLLPALFFPPLRWPLYVLLGGFAFTLFVLVDISFIGQLTLLLIATMAALDATAAHGSVPPAAWGTADWILYALLGSLFTLAAISSSGLVKLRSGWISKIMSWTTHFRPFTVFVEIHFYGLYIFRLMAKMKSGALKPVLTVFNDDGHPGRLQFWRPRTFQGSMYGITDYCIAIIENLEERRATRERFVEDIAFAGYEELSPAERADLREIEVQVRVFDPADDFEPDTRHWLSPEWKPIGTVTGFPDALRLHAGTPPPRYKKTFRWPVIFQ